MRRIIKKIVEQSAIKKKQKAITDSINSEQARLDGFTIIKKDIREEIKVLKGDRDRIFKEVDNANSILTNTKDEVEKLSHAKTQAASDFTIASQRLEGAQTSYKSLEKSVVKLSDDIEKKKGKEKAMIQESVSTTQKKLDSIVIEYNEAEADKKDVDNKLESARGVLGSVSQEIKDKEKVLVNTKKAVTKIDELLMTKKKASVEASEKIRGLHDKIVELEKAAKEKDSELKVITGKKDTAEEELDKIKRITLGFVRREARMKSLVPKLKELYKEAGIDIQL